MRSVLVPLALLLTVVVGCKKDPMEKVSDECFKRSKAVTDDEVLDADQGCLLVYVEETFKRDNAYDPRARGKDGSAANENTHFVTVLSNIESDCRDAARSARASGCKQLCRSALRRRCRRNDLGVDVQAARCLCAARGADTRR
jgi:hypothetical protein